MSSTAPQAHDVSQMSDAELRKLENRIARKYAQATPWNIVVWGFANLVVWLALWPLVLTGTIPLWLGFIASTICLCLVYAPTHDAQHDIIGRPGTRLRWLNELLGHATSWMILLPFGTLRTNSYGSSPSYQ